MEKHRLRWLEGSFSLQRFVPSGMGWLCFPREFPLSCGYEVFKTEKEKKKKIPVLLWH